MTSGLRQCDLPKEVILRRVGEAIFANLRRSVGDLEPWKPPNERINCTFCNGHGGVDWGQTGTNGPAHTDCPICHGAGMKPEGQRGLQVLLIV